MDHAVDTFSGHPTHGFRAYQPGMMVGKYKLEDFLGRGGMGEVWKAWDTQGHVHVALKFLPSEFRNNEDAADQMRLASQAARQLAHPHLCQTHDFVNDPLHGPYLVMAFVPGITLDKYRKRFREERLPFDQVVKILTPVAAALDYAHHKIIQTANGERHGALHRDVKPQNIMLALEGETIAHICLIDLGLAAEIRSTASRFTRGLVVTAGTRPYMSLEQLTGQRKHWDGRTDQYSLAAVAYELLAGELPFEADDLELLVLRIKNGPPEPIEGLAESANAALRKGLAWGKEDRFPTCVEFIEALRGRSAILEVVGSPDLDPNTQIDEKPKHELHLIKCPKPGTFYATPHPDAEPFVRAGSWVTPTTVVCCLEETGASYYIEIQAECTGVITEVLARNQQSVEHGQVLFKVNTACFEPPIEKPTATRTGSLPGEEWSDTPRSIGAEQ
jgi:serine/threonine protein kinase